MNEEKKLDEKTLEDVTGGSTYEEKLKAYLDEREQAAEDFRARNCGGCIYQYDTRNCPYALSFTSIVWISHNGDPNATCYKRTVG